MWPRTSHQTARKEEQGCRHTGVKAEGANGRWGLDVAGRVWLCHWLVGLSGTCFFKKLADFQLEVRYLAQATALNMLACLGPLGI